MSLAGFETAIPAIEWQQTYALDRTATGIGQYLFQHYLTKDVTYMKFLTMKYPVLFGILFERRSHLYATV
jgi:hypothetical protein